VSARKLQQVVANVRNALAIEILTAAAGLDQRAPLTPSKGVAAAHGAVRSRVAPLTEDRPLYRDIATVAGMISAGALSAAAQDAVGRLV
jgi:histidine ammonia-lyase